MTLRFSSGSVTPASRSQEHGLGVLVDEWNVVVTAEEARNFLRLALAHEAGIDEDASELLPDRLVKKNRCHRRIHAARKPTNYPSVANLLSDGVDGAGAERGHRPTAVASGDTARKILQERRAMRRVDYLGVKLDTVEATPIVGDGGERCRLGAGDHAEAVRHCSHRVAVAHPHLLARADLPDAIEECARFDDVKVSPPELALGRGDDATAQRCAHGLLAVADAQKRNAELKNAFVRPWRLRLRERCGATREDDAVRRHALDLGRRRGKGSDFAIDPSLAHAPGDQLRDLRAKVEDENVLVHRAPPRAEHFSARLNDFSQCIDMQSLFIAN